MRKRHRSGVKLTTREASLAAHILVDSGAAVPDGLPMQGTSEAWMGLIPMKKEGRGRKMGSKFDGIIVCRWGKNRRNLAHVLAHKEKIRRKYYNNQIVSLWTIRLIT